MSSIFLPYLSSAPTFVIRQQLASKKNVVNGRKCGPYERLVYSSSILKKYYVEYRNLRRG
jgi:hypothetical protein